MVHMKKEKRKSGISVVGDVPWGTHLCQFYTTKEDLLDILIPYFKTGLENNEFCMWVTSEPLNVEEAKTALGKVVKNLDEYIKKGQIEILDYRSWYVKSKKFDSDRVSKGWVEKEKCALQNGFDGLRLTGNTFLLGKNDWDDFKSYEETVNDVIDKHRMIAICSYSLEKCNTSEIIDVVSNHQFAIIRRENKWNIIESSERKKAEGQLKNSEERYRTLIELAPDSIVTMDLKGYITSCNSEAIRHLGYSKDDLVGKHFSTIGFLHAKDIPKYLKVFVSILRGKGTDVYELTVNDKDGASRIVETHIGLITENNKISGVLAITRDITERKKIEKEVIESEEKLKQILDSSPDAITVTDLNGNIIECNQTASKMYGSSKAELIGKNALEFVSPKNREKAKDNLTKTLELGLLKNVEYTLLTKDGREYPVEHSTSLIRDTSGNPQSSVAIVRDITERKKAQEEIKSMSKFPLENPNPVLRITKDGEVVYSNKAGFEVIDFWKTNVGKEALKRWRNIIRKMFSSKNLKAEEEEEEEEVNDKIFSFVVSPVIDEGYVNIYGRDITERKKAEENLRQSEEKFRILFDSSPELIIETDEKGNISAMNPMMAKSMGAPSEKLIGKNIFDIFPKEIAEERAKTARTALKEMKNQESEDERAGRYFQNIYVPITNPDGKKTIQMIARDVTSQKKADIAIKASEVQLSNAVQIARLGPWEYDVEHDLFTFNDAFYAVYNTTAEQNGGYTMSSAEYAKRFVHPEDESLVGLEVRNAIETQDPGFNRQIEHRIIYPNGETGYITVRFFIIKDEKGKTIKTYGVNQDITERKKAEEKIKIFSDAITSASDCIILTDLKGNITYANQTTINTYGYTPEELLKLNITTLDADQTIAKKIMQEITEKGKWTGEVTNIRKNKEKIPIILTAFTIKDEKGNPTGTMGIIKNITERKKAEANLKQSEENYRFLFNDVPVGISITDKSGRIVDCNKYMAEMFKTTCEGFRANNIKSFYVNPEDRERLLNLVHKEGKVVDWECSFKRNDNDIFFAILNVDLVDKDGQKLLLSTLRDITERKMAEEKIRKQNAQLKKLDQIKTDFLNTTSHELRTPVASIKGYIQMLLKQILGEITEEQKKALEVLLRNTNRLDHLIQDILDISRLESGTIKFITEKTDVTKMVKEIAETMQTSADLKKIKINIDIQKEIPDLMIDQERIKQVLTNLVDNAIKFSPDDSLINIYTKMKKDNVLFEVQDFGRGIPKNKQKKIFERFYQVDSGIDRKFGGIGLGLTISKKIIDTYGGQIWVDSTLGKGSSFKFSVPTQSTKNIEYDLQEIYKESP